MIDIDKMDDPECSCLDLIWQVMRTGKALDSSCLKHEWQLVNKTVRILRDHAASEDSMVYRLCEQIGYGNVMQRAGRLWGEKDGVSGGGKTVGPYADGTVPCWHPGADPHCDWCYGCGWLTKNVAELVRAATKTNDDSD